MRWASCICTQTRWTRRPRESYLTEGDLTEGDLTEGDLTEVSPTEAATRSAASRRPMIVVLVCTAAEAAAGSVAKAVAIEPGLTMATVAVDAAATREGVVPTREVQQEEEQQEQKQEVEAAPTAAAPTAAATKGVYPRVLHREAVCCAR
jgi:hypothetical protein